MITIIHGTRTTTVDASDVTDVASILTSDSLKGVLRFGDNVEAIIDGRTASLGDPLADGDEVVINTKAHSKQ